MELKDIFIRYKSATLDFIDALDNDEGGREFLLIREEMLEILTNGSYSKVDAKKIVEELEINKVENLANEAVRRSQQRIKVELVKIKQQRNATETYGNTFKNINFINKKI